MASHQSQLEQYFRLKPIRSARVSEISETTAASPVAPEDRVNFHIGNPLQDRILSSAFLRLALGLDIRSEELHDDNIDGLLEACSWEETERKKLEFLRNTIQKSTPYMPRGGYVRKNPHALIKAFSEWLLNQQEPLQYDTGEQSGQREIILASGGIHEALRIFLFSISGYSTYTPVRIVLDHYSVSPLLKDLPNLRFEELSEDEREARQQLLVHCEADPTMPTYLITGRIFSEETRRFLRTWSLKYPLFFVEVNDAPNHYSLARETKLINRVVRFLTPAIFSPYLRNSSIVFIVGNAEYLNVIENVHFNLKGTPSAAEVELLIYFLEHREQYLEKVQDRKWVETKPAFEGLKLAENTEICLPQIAESVEKKISQIVNRFADKIDKIAVHSTDKALQHTAVTKHFTVSQYYDEYASHSSLEVIDELLNRFDENTVHTALLQSYLVEFVKHQPQYDPRNCVVVSGSSRTALGLLGFHCGITEVVVPDLSWSYEQCFPVVHAVPLTPQYELDVDAIIKKLNELLQYNPQWNKYGAVVLNNPHNATGRIFNEEDIRKIVAFCLQRYIYIVDDLSYQNVAPVTDLPHIKTVREIALQLVKEGIISRTHIKYIITVHSMSKTDCLAGARLAVTEIPNDVLRIRFEELNNRIVHNITAVLICYLFYRNTKEAVQAFWRLRNTLFYERTQALLTAVKQLPAERNPFKISILPPTGSMYPLLQIELLPPGLSLDWLASSLARRGIGMLPLATFARTEEGYETGRKTFRLTLGGVDGGETLLLKTRYVLIHLNRLIKDEAAQYNRKRIPVKIPMSESSRKRELETMWDSVVRTLHQMSLNNSISHQFQKFIVTDWEYSYKQFCNEYIYERLDIFKSRLLDRSHIHEELIARALTDNGTFLEERLHREFVKDSLQRRQIQFRLRTHDRTVHPTQMYSLRAEIVIDKVINSLLQRQSLKQAQYNEVLNELIAEFFGLSVPITSRDEADEILLDFATMVCGEQFAELFSESSCPTFLSFWSDWDGSNRPSGQGHRLVATLVMENVNRMAKIFQLLCQLNPHFEVDADLELELHQLPERNRRFTNLLDDITFLTHQLEHRYRGIVPFTMPTTTLQNIATKFHLRRDPVKVLWQHNDRYERKMLELRSQRRRMLEYYFRLNKKLRKQLHSLIPVLRDNRTSLPLLNELVEYKDILKRTIITPRIQQGMITARDQFAIDTTVFNVFEINAVGGLYGNPGMALALQISLSSKPEALISLERKIHARMEQTKREYPQAEVPTIWSIPLFEDVKSVQNIGPYLDHVWDYATQSRRSDQTPQERFTEIICEVFIAGSDLSQQISQPSASSFYLKAKYDLQVWLANHGITEEVRIKLGSGEPMQRQGGYYSYVAGKPAFINSQDNRRRFEQFLPPATRRSTLYAVTPLLGVMKGGDLRTFQSNLSEHIRYLPVHDFVDLLYHVKESQSSHRNDLIRAAESIVESRLLKKSRTSQELERLTGGIIDQIYDEFLKELTENFRHILYGKEADVVGIHTISYFIARSIPQLRDRPTNRPVTGLATERGQRILEHIAETIPFAKHGSLLRAISHNQAQTAVLGINQLTTGLFRSLDRFAEKTFAPAEQLSMICERILPHLPVYEILNSLRLYYDRNLTYLNRIETAFPAGNSAFVALREDFDAMLRYIPLLQQELVRRHGLNVQDFFEGGAFIPGLLPTLRPDLAVLLQKDLFNTSYDLMISDVKGNVSETWEQEVKKYLDAPVRIKNLREKIWNIIGESVYQRVQSFTELATALYAFSSVHSFETPAGSTRERKLSPALIEFFRTARAEDEMRNFLVGAIEYLSLFTESNIEVPVSIVRAMNDIERLAQIEEHALPPQKQNLLRFYILQIARIAGENG